MNGEGFAFFRWAGLRRRNFPSVCYGDRATMSSARFNLMLAWATRRREGY